MVKVVVKAEFAVGAERRIVVRRDIELAAGWVTREWVVVGDDLESNGWRS
jgi:hypothetical protein